MAHNIATMTVGLMGAGKSLIRGVIFLVKDFLPNESGLYITNLPLDVDACAEYVARRGPRRLYAKNVEKYRKRIHIIPEEEMTAWRRDEGDPVKYLMGLNLKRSYVMIDEAHQFFGKGSNRKWIDPFVAFIAKLRHHKSQIEFITQSEKLLHPSVRELIQRRYSIVPSDNRTLPYIKIKYADFFELWGGLGKLLGPYGWGHESPVAQHEYTKLDKGWNYEGTVIRYRNPSMFKLYDSHGEAQKKELWEKEAENEVEAEKVERAEDPIFEFQRRSFPGLLLWFCRKNFFQLGKAVFFCCLIVWLVPMGGGGKLYMKLFNELRGLMFMSSGLGDGEGAEGEGEDVPEAVAEVVPVVEVEPLASPADPRVGELAAKVKELTDAVAKEREEKTHLRVEIDKFKARELAGGEIVLLEPGAAVFRSGQRVRVGEEIKHGMHKGKRLQAVDVEARTVDVAGDVILVGRVWSLKPAGGK